MHSSYALSAEDFAVERNGSSEPLDTLWPGGWQPDDRLGVILAHGLTSSTDYAYVFGRNRIRLKLA